VIAFEQNLVAAADAHQLMADVFEAGGWISGAEEGEDGEAERGGVESAAEGRVESRRHNL
jgi:hypothetical protein